MITEENARQLFESTDLISLGVRAHAVRRQLHPEQIVSYAVGDGNPNVTRSEIAILELSADSTPDERHHRLVDLRDQQEATGRFLSFLVVPTGKPEPTASEYMKTLAIARIYLNNILHAQVPVAGLDSKLAQLALRFGADDLGTLPTPEHGERKTVTEEQVRRLIRDAGFTPKQRDPEFRTYFLY
jgi:cyclic dehypoxanthinyl futalosine synthase